MRHCLTEGDRVVGVSSALHRVPSLQLRPRDRRPISNSLRKLSKSLITGLWLETHFEAGFSFFFESHLNTVYNVSAALFSDPQFASATVTYWHYSGSCRPESASATIHTPHTAISARAGSRVFYPLPNGTGEQWTATDFLLRYVTLPDEIVNGVVIWTVCRRPQTTRSRPITRFHYATANNNNSRPTSDNSITLYPRQL